MSDTVKLIIEIPKEAKQAFDNAYSNDLRGGYYDCGGVIGKAIQNGIPLDDVKAEITKIPTHNMLKAYEVKPKVFQILDNIGKESEVGNESKRFNYC